MATRWEECERERDYGRARVRARAGARVVWLALGLVVLLLLPRRRWPPPAADRAAGHLAAASAGSSRSARTISNRSIWPSATPTYAGSGPKAGRRP